MFLQMDMRIFLCIWENIIEYKWLKEFVKQKNVLTKLAQYDILMIIQIKTKYWFRKGQWHAD